MIPSISILLLATLIVLYDLPFWTERRWKRESTVFVSVLLLGVVLSIWQALHLPIFSPIEGVTALFQPVAQLLDYILGIRRG